MHYVLLSSTGNMIDSFEDEAAEDVALMTYDDDGAPVGDPIHAKTSSTVR